MEFPEINNLLDGKSLEKFSDEMIDRQWMDKSKFPLEVFPKFG